MKKFEQTGSLGFDERFGEAAEPANELQIFESRHIAIEMGLFWDIANCATESNHVIANIAAFKKDAPSVWSQHSGHNLDSG